MSVVAIAILLCLTVVSIAKPPGPNKTCLKCMCEAYGCNNQCYRGACGWYRITEPYYEDCGEPGASYWACVHNKACSRRCVVNYMKRYGGPRPYSCERYARTHMGGRWGRRTRRATNYWLKVKECLEG